MNDYQEAIQHPDVSFPKYAELQACLPELDEHEVPIAYSGNYAVTFRLKNGKSRDRWAIRCFTKEVDRVVERYDKISQFLAAKPDRALVEAKLLLDGMLVGGKYFHVIKMEWIHGSLLNSYIEGALDKNRVDRLSVLSDQFVELGKRLDRLRIAHGDIQHGNVIIDREGLIHLVDYDDMFLEALSPLGFSSGVGHENYQHPRRPSNAYDHTLDRFPLIVMYLSLLALSKAPRLWKDYCGGDDCILFRKDDFLNTTQSKLFTELFSIPELKDKAYEFAAICGSDFQNIPSIRDFASGEFQSRAAVIAGVPPDASPSEQFENRSAAHELHGPSDAKAAFGERLRLAIGGKKRSMAGASARMFGWGALLFAILSLSAIFSMGLLARRAGNGERRASHFSTGTASVRHMQHRVTGGALRRGAKRRKTTRITPLPKRLPIRRRSDPEVNRRLLTEELAKKPIIPVVQEARSQPHSESTIVPRSVKRAKRELRGEGRKVRKVAGSVAGIPSSVKAPGPIQSCSKGSVPAHVISLLSPRAGVPVSGSSTSGEIVVRVRVEANGSVGAAVIEQSSNNVALDFAALSAARRSTYAPAEEDCNPIPGNVDVSFAY